MTTQEFSDSFDTLVGSYVRNTDFDTQEPLAFDEYEKSVFLTKAQEQLVVSLYNGRNSNGDSFESSEEMRRYLEPLVVQDTAKAIVQISLLGGYSYGIKLKEDLMFIVYESADLQLDRACLPSQGIQIQPITHDEYHNVKNNPFRGANEHRVLRLDSNLGRDNNQYVELVSKYPVISYTYRYIRKPKPIILTTLEDVSIGDGETNAQTSELNSALHDRILELAVQMALQSRGLNTNQRGQ